MGRWLADAILQQRPRIACPTLGKMSKRRTWRIYFAVDGVHLGVEGVMQYFFHIRTGMTRIVDDEGLGCADIAAVRAEMLASAKDLAAASIRSGSGVDGRILEIEDDSGNVIETFPIRGILHG